MFRSLSLGFMFGVVLVLSLVGCGCDDKVVASFPGWTLTRGEWRTEFVRAQGDSALANSEASDRIAFAELLLNRELLLNLAREACPEPDVKRARLDRVVYEKNVLRHLAAWQSERVPPNPAYFESLSTAAGLNFHRETFPLVRERFVAFWDSVGAARRAGASFDVQEIQAPRWIFEDATKSEPLFELRGATWTVDEFVRSLDAIDVDHWPTKGDSARIDAQIKQRAHRLLYVRESERIGILEEPRFQEKMERVRERHLLEQFRDRVIRVRADLSEADLREYFGRHREFYRSEGKSLAIGVGGDGAGGDGTGGGGADGERTFADRNHNEGTHDEELDQGFRQSDGVLFDAMRDRIERNAVEEWTDREIDRLLAERRLELGAEVYEGVLRKK